MLSLFMTAREWRPKPLATGWRRAVVWTGLFTAILTLAVGSLPLASASSSSGAIAPWSVASSSSTVSTQLSMQRSTVVDNVSSEFWGIDLSPTEKLDTDRSDELAAAGIGYILWPSAKLNDEYDLVDNIIHKGDGSTSRPRTDASAFVDWCRSIKCHAIIGVPGEINNTTFVEEEVKYLVDTLHFQPAFWEIGNEPGLWKHYNIPWSQWSSTQNSGITPQGYAELVHRYISAMHSVDSTAQIIGLPGTGLGHDQEPIWIYDTVKLNGPHLAAVSIHVYPAPHLHGSEATLSRFDHSLVGKASIERRARVDWNEIHSACPTCHIALMITEFNAATVGVISDSGPYSKFMSGFDEAPYIAALVTQALQERVSNLDLYDLQSAFSGAMIASNGTPRPLYYLYSEMLVHLDPKAVDTNFSGSLGDFFGEVTIGNGTAMSLLLVNANPSMSVRVDLAGSGFTVDKSGTSWNYTSSTSRPTEKKWSGSIPDIWTLPPECVILIQVE